jgi:hypothetical protein
MIRTVNFGGILAIIYLCWNPWSISINPSSIVSSPIVQIIELLHPVVIGIFVFILLSIYVISLLTRDWEIGLYILSMYLLTLITSIANNMLMLKSFTTTMLFTIHHPIPFELKVSYLQSEIFEIIMLNCPELFADKERLLILQKILDQEFSLEVIKNMDAKELHDYVCLILNKYNIEIHSRELSNIHTIMLVIMAGGLAMLF